MKKKNMLLFTLTVVILVGIAGIYMKKHSLEEESNKSDDDVIVEVVDSMVPDTGLYVEDTYEDEITDVKTEDDVNREDEILVQDGELQMDTYEELKGDSVIESSAKKDTEDEEISGDNSDTEEKQSKVIVVDESEETMKDETKGTEEEYNVNQEPQRKIELHEVKEKEGKETKIDTKPGGKRNIGTWE